MSDETVTLYSNPPASETATFQAKHITSETAVFILPDRFKELLSEKKDLTIDDLLDHG